MERPDFSGVWKFNRERSLLQIPPPDSTTFVITHKEPSFHLERTHTFGGSSDLFAVELLTDGGSVELTHAGVEIRARLYWEAESLVFHSEVSREGVHGTNIVRYRLADEGHTFIALEQLSFEGQSHENNWVFDRQ
jgi:hypothetical protein